MPPHTLPTPRTFLKDLLSSLPAPAPESDATTTPSNPLASLAPPSKNLLLTLHVLFPHEFLPALDLLDRRLVTRFRIHGRGGNENEDALELAPASTASRGSSQHSRIYYVRSAQQRASRYSTSVDTTTSYEVRLTAWNCSCPAFAFAAFPSALPEPVPPEDGAYLEDWSFGGVSLGTGTPPVCKHLLACVLIERCEMFKDFVEERDVSVEEAAGWAAGWGD
ncbi:hypothetical protein K432DRAFT_343476 [Lepidopterella palustris CBS 459.81]|uniref:SWIM-type domain-containing protein n=1 Tax=Lepidopterella palustris CBS 459.81 TaxID=1314670 RepID=A0A8E2EJU2_9PEZI|nr:hypothetical protein K432DRAFT_343476 [Lepidopterella palustris CBS 459.81]